MKKAKSRRKKFVVLGIVTAFLVVLEAFLFIWFYGAKYPEFDKLAREEFLIPGLDDGISPQGLCTLPENEAGYTFAISGYMVDKSPSRIYLINGKTNEHKYITLTRGGKADTAHFGGVTCTGNYIVVTSDKYVARVPLTAALAAKDGAAIEETDSFQTGMQNAYCYAAGGKLYAGEFYRPGNYETHHSHHREVMGGKNFGYIYEYEIDEAAEGGVKSTTPTKAISVREQVQGIAVTAGEIVLSTSYGLPDSRLFFYKNILSEDTNLTATVDGKEVPLYVLDSGNLVSELVAPCMSEELVYGEDGRLYVLFESMCDKYKYFTRTRVLNVFSLTRGE